MELNLDGSQDPFYRYKVQRPTIKVEGSSKMIKTILLNANEVAQGIYRPIELFMIHFASVHGTKYNIKNSKVYFSGSFTVPQLEQQLMEFIQLYVLCKKCNNPETDISVIGQKKDRKIKVKCRSCGHSFKYSPITNVDRYLVNH